MFKLLYCAALALSYQCENGGLWMVVGTPKHSAYISLYHVCTLYSPILQVRYHISNGVKTVGCGGLWAHPSIYRPILPVRYHISNGVKTVGCGGLWAHPIISAYMSISYVPHQLMEIERDQPSDPGSSEKTGNPKDAEDPGNHATNLQRTSGDPKIRKSESSAIMGRPPPIDGNGRTLTNQSRNLHKT